MLVRPTGPTVVAPRHVRPEVSRLRARGLRIGREQLFVFFSNRLGCLGSLIVSVIVTAVLLVVLRLLSVY
jgi:hypothetical protein